MTEEKKQTLEQKAHEAIKYTDRKYECLKCHYRGFWLWQNYRAICPNCRIPMTTPTGKIKEPRWFDKNPMATLEWEDNAILIKDDYKE